VPPEESPKGAQGQGPEEAKPRSPWVEILLFLVCIGLIGYALFTGVSKWTNFPPEGQVYLLLSLGAVTGIIAWFVVSFRSARAAGRADQEARKQLQREEFQVAEDLKETDPSFAALWAVTQKRIDHYHLIATAQAQRSFISARIATIGGFILVVVLGIIAANAETAVSAICTGAVGIVGGALSAYIGATFMKTQSEASAQLGQFFLQPVEFSRMLSAERLLSHLGDDAKTAAVQQMIGSAMAPAAPAEASKTTDSANQG
jgi:hypothetical protein